MEKVEMKFKDARVHKCACGRSWSCIDGKDVDAAVEELKTLIYGLYSRFETAEIWRVKNDEVCDMCEAYVLDKIEEVFG